MLQYREKVARGTEDFPFAHYKMRLNNRMIEPHWHPEIEIIYVVDEEVTVHVSEEKYVLEPGDIFFVNPEELHSFTSYEHTSHYHAAVFSASLFTFQGSHFLEQEFTLPVVQGRLKFPRLIGREHPQYEVIQPIVHHIFCRDTESKALVFADVTALFCALVEHSLMVKTSDDISYKHTEDVKRCIKYMEEQFARKITLSELADLVHMSSNYFCSYFKQHTGVSPFTQLNYIRIKEATNLLMQSDDSIVDVAEACGFENVSFFIRKFKEIMGCTPSVYRKKMRV